MKTREITIIRDIFDDFVFWLVLALVEGTILYVDRLQ